MIYHWLRDDPEGDFHRAILAWLALPPATRPSALRRIGRRQPSRHATATLLQVLGITLRAYRLFGNLAMARRWLTREQGAPPALPLVDVMKTSRRRALVRAIRRTAHGIY